MLWSLRVIAGIAGIYVFWSAGPAWGGWGQLDGSTDDKAVLLAAKEGSGEFLRASIGVLEALRRLETGDRKNAGELGRKAADGFTAAASKFETIRDRVKATQKLTETLTGYLNEANSETRRAALGSCGVAEARLVPGLAFIQVTAKERQAAGVFEELAKRAKYLAGRSAAFFGAIQKGTYRPVEEAALLVDLSFHLGFGGYVSAAFLREVSGCPKAPEPAQRR
ncbi:MAG: hypothetical protein ACRD1X_01900 [Vicinamibacteria bacterium]